jgi:hypothetical protein
LKRVCPWFTKLKELNNAAAAAAAAALLPSSPEFAAAATAAAVYIVAPQIYQLETKLPIRELCYL